MSKINKLLGPIAQLGARLNGIEKVEGSNPSGSTERAISLTNRSCAIIVKILKVVTRVVSHPFSESGERGGSPAQRP